MVASRKLQNLIETWADSYVNSTELVEKIVKQAEEEEVGKKELRLLIEGSLKKRGLKEREIRRLIPADLKDERARIVANSSKSKPLRQSLPQKSEKTTVNDHAPTIREQDEEAGRTLPEEPEQSATEQWKAAADAEKAKDEEIASLKQRLEAADYELEQLRRLLVSYKTAATVNIHGHDIPLIIAVDAQHGKVSVEVNEAVARRMYAQ